ncbi:hypothetical protein BC938DRAFT_483318 [Jimgerdemannia flammicorona]|uniref:Uncharacterized protein n=1 Tax=Jimgerdemannia flammicorona TaxID=994334 RepID=A0A433QCA4_9FUNG|nr:hypothetical protein BC938DRAFT_483318 [Jimgerdemannia flammicorona]
MNVLDELASATEDDKEATVLIFYSGRGHRVKIMTATGRKLKALDSKQTILLLNCCFAAGIELGTGHQNEKELMALGNVPLTKKNIDYLKEHYGLCVLSSSMANERSWTGVALTFQQKKLQHLYAAHLQGAHMRVLENSGIRLPVPSSELLLRQNPFLDFAGIDNAPMAYYSDTLLAQLRALGDEDDDVELEKSDTESNDNLAEKECTMSFLMET